MKRKYNQVVEKIIKKHRLDRRKRYFVWDGLLCTHSYFTKPCSGCSCDTEYPCSCCRERGAGCDDCGHTGKSVTYFADPVMVNDSVIVVPVRGRPGRTKNQFEDKG